VKDLSIPLQLQCLSRSLLPSEQHPRPVNCPMPQSSHTGKAQWPWSFRVLQMVSDQGYSRVLFGFGIVTATATACEHWGSHAKMPRKGSGERMLPEGWR
jgi:hypothetical protein